MHGVVMVVDDDFDIRETVREALEMLGYQVYVAANGKEALEILEKVEPPCLILLDLMMPVMNGWQLRERMVAESALAGIPVVALSADKSLERAMEGLGVRESVRKPLAFTALKDIAERYCGARG